MKKFFPYILILVALVGLFGPTKKAQAVQVVSEPPGNCTIKDKAGPDGKNLWGPESMQKGACSYETLSSRSNLAKPDSFYEWLPTSVGSDSTTPAKSTFQVALSKYTCNPLPTFARDEFSVPGCLANIWYYSIFQLVSLILYITAIFFDAMLSLSLSSSLFTSTPFISSGWAAVRDLSNIFFILILLYIAIKIILDLGGHEAKKMIARVIIIALLINFSMFFTQVVIDSSNILALVFYNKLKVTTANGQPISYTPVTKGGTDKDVAGVLYNSFDATKLISGEFFKEKVQINLPGQAPTSMDPGPGTLIGIIAIASLIMLFAAYCFAVSGFFFVSRLIELFILIIFSPFAFMSSTVHILSDVEYIGWDSWFKRLLKVSFMAPIFMFFLYLIFLLIQSKLFDGMLSTQAGFIQKILSTVIPAVMILVLLLKATKFAKDSSGAIGDMVLTGAKFVGGLALGAATGGAALAGRASVGAFMKGASTGDTSAARLRAERTSGVRDVNLTGLQRLKGNIAMMTPIDRLQQRAGARLNADQHNVEHAAHARQNLNSTASDITHGKKKNWDELNGEERYQARRQMARDKVIRDNMGANAITNPLDPSFVAGLNAGFGNRKWESLTTAERALIDAADAVGDNNGHAVAGHALAESRTVADTVITDARRKQGAISNILQSGVGGTYDVRNLANIVAKEQTTGIAKFASSLTGLAASSIRGGLKQAGVSYGTAEGKFFKDLGSTISEALKNVKINVDLSRVGEVKKEDSHGGGHP